MMKEMLATAEKHDSYISQNDRALRHSQVSRRKHADKTKLN